MQDIATKPSSAASELKDPRLFREACYLDGQWVQSKSGATINVDNPATGEIIGKVPKLGGAETKQAIEAANRAFPAWSKKTAKERAAVLRRWFDLMMANQEDLARLMTLEQGKPLAESKGEVAYAAAFLEWFGEEAKRVYGDTIPAAPGRQAHRRHQAAHRSRRLHHAVEFSAGDDHPQSRPGDRRRLHRRAEARFANSVFGAGSRGTGRARRRSQRRLQRADGFGHGNWRRTDLESHRSKALLHRFHRNRKSPDGPVRGHREKTFARTGRQCAVHRL